MDEVSKFFIIQKNFEKNAFQYCVNLLQDIQIRPPYLVLTKAVKGVCLLCRVCGR